jgi:hypothetical protein
VNGGLPAASRALPSTTNLNLFLCSKSAIQTFQTAIVIKDQHGAAPYNSVEYQI